MHIGITNMKNEKKKRTLILTQTDPATDIMFNNWIRNGYNADIIFKTVPKPLRLVRRFWMNIPFPCLSIWLGKWKSNLNKYDTIILHASEWTRNIPEWIHNQKPKLRIIYWYWNPVNKLSSPLKVTDTHVEFWTFDPIDAQKYGMKKNIQYYSKPKSESKNPMIYEDVYFIGHNKGRQKVIKSIEEKLIRQQITYKFDVMKNNFIPYYEVCSEISHARSILEINQAGQAGLTLRAMESLFFEKKLITNNRNIKMMDFYSEKNIFILEERPILQLKSFLFSPYDHSVDKYKNNYDLNAWFNNFFDRV